MTHVESILPQISVDNATGHGAWKRLSKCSWMQCVAVCCNVLQCVAVCCSVLQCVTVCYSALQCVAVCCIVLQCLAMCRSVLQCGAITHTQKMFARSWQGPPLQTPLLFFFWYFSRLNLHDSSRMYADAVCEGLLSKRLFCFSSFFSLFEL